MPEGACLLLDNGDALSGTLLPDLLAERFHLLARREGRERPVHRMIAAMMALDYDTRTLGNYEFDNSLSFLRTALSDPDFTHCPPT
jgi:2',3'-cyclic-nucleotide 2'-phosphodiesterase/3'-nucleotidase